MGGIKGLIGWLWAGTAQRSLTLQSSEGWLMDSLGSTKTMSGISITPDKAMQLSAVSACVRLIAESIASLPLHVYRRVDDARRERVSATPASRLLHDEPNEMMTSFVFRETLSAHLLLWGNAYALIMRDNAGRPIELLPVHPSCVTVRKSATLGLVYDLRMADAGVVPRVSQADMLHIPGLSYDGILGMSPIRYAAQSIGLGLAAEQFGAAFFGNGSTPSGYITLPGKLTKEQAAQMRESWYATYGGVSNSNKTAVLFENGKFERISIPPDEAQFIETRKFQVADIARWYRVPPHMIGDLERATFSNIEHQALEFVTTTLRPWLVRFEQEINRKLFPSSTSGAPSDLYAEFKVDALLRGDIKSRGDYYIRGRQWGWLSANDIRALENLEPITGGDIYLNPLNMASAAKDQPAQEQEPTP